MPPKIIVNRNKYRTENAINNEGRFIRSVALNSTFVVSNEGSSLTTSTIRLNMRVVLSLEGGFMNETMTPIKTGGNKVFIASGIKLSSPKKTLLSGTSTSSTSTILVRKIYTMLRKASEESLSPISLYFRAQIVATSL